MTTIKLKNGSGAPLAGDLVQGEPALDLTNKRLYTEDSGGTVIEVGTNPTSLTTGGLTVDGGTTLTKTGTNASPHIKLTESGDTREFNIFNDGSGNGRLVLADTDDTPDSEIVLADNGILQFRTANSERMTITSAGNVGIGTSSPTSYSGQTNLNINSAGVSRIDFDISDSLQGMLVAESGYMSLLANTGNYLMLGSNNTEHMRIDASGNVGIGTNPDNKLHVYKGASGHSWSFDSGDGFILENSDSVSINLATPSANSANILFSDADARGQGRIVYAHGSDYMGFHTAGIGNERMRIDSSGRTLFGNTDSLSGKPSGVICPIGYVGRAGTTGSSSNVFNIYWTGTAAELYIDTSNLGAISTSSDYRIKKNINPMESGAISRVLDLKPITYELTDYKELFKSDGVVREGFIAHEVQEVIPSGASGTKDEEDCIQSLRVDAIVAVLTKAVQEQQVLIESLTARVAQLETN